MVAEGELPRKPRFPKARCKIRHDDNGTSFTVEEETVGSTDKSPAIKVWWSREPRKLIGGVSVISEHLIMRQENGRVGADVLILTPGQVYDLIDALNRAVESI